MFKNLFKVLGVSGILFAILVVPAFGQSSDLFFGQNHFYSVIFRGNGEAIVYARIVFTNNTEQAQKEFSFEIPGVTPTELVVFQQKINSICARPGYGGPEMPCAQYKEPVFENYSAGVSPSYGVDEMMMYRNWETEYKKATTTLSGNLYKLSLPFEVTPSKSSALVIWICSRIGGS